MWQAMIDSGKDEDGVPLKKREIGVIKNKLQALKSRVDKKRKDSDL